MFQVAQSQDRSGFVWIKEILWPTFEHIERLQESKSGLTGVPTGFADIDKMTSGLQKGELCIVAARPSMGKTSWVLNVAQTAAIEHNIPVAIFSLEMGKEQLVQRLLCAEGRVDSQRLRRGQLTADEYQRLAAAAAHLNTAPLWIDDSPGATILEMRAKARRLKAETDLGLSGHRLHAAHGGARTVGEPSAGGERDIQGTEGPCPGAGSAGRGSEPAEPGPGTADRPETAALGSEGVRIHRAGCRCGHVPVPAGVLLWPGGQGWRTPSKGRRRW